MSISFYEMKFRAQLSWAWKKFYNLGARQSHTENKQSQALLKF